MIGKIIPVYTGIQSQFFIKPNLKFFHKIFKSPTIFQIQTQQIIFNNKVTWGADLTLDIPHNGDLLSSCYIYFRLPQIPSHFINISGHDIDIFADFFYPNFTAHSIIDNVTLWAGEKIIETHNHFFLECYDDIHSHNKFSDNILIQKTFNDHFSDPFLKFKTQTDLFVPLRFWFCTDFHLALPLCAIKSTPFKFQIKLKTFQNFISERNILSIQDIQSITSEFIQNANPFTYSTKIYYDELGNIISRDQFLVMMSRKFDILSSNMLLDFIHISREEQLAFTNNILQFRIPIYKTIDPVIIKYNPLQRIKLRFTGILSELIWCYTPAINQFYNNFYNFTRFGLDPIFFRPIFPDSKISSSSFFDLDYEPIKSCTLFFNGIERVRQDALFFRISQMYDKTHLIPSQTKYVYMYNFGLHSLHNFPMGTSNLDLIQTCEMEMLLNSPTKFEITLTKTNELLPYPDTYFRCFYKTWEILVISKSFASFLFY